MAAARTAVTGLSTTDLEQIRDTLATGRKPKVQFTEAAGQIAGQLGQVVQLTDPEVSDEWVVVRFGRDELPFSPTDLVIPPKAPPRRAAVSPAAAPAPVPAPREETPVPTAPALSTVEPDSAAPTPAPASATGSGEAEIPGKPEKPEKKVAARKVAKPRTPTGLTVTLAYADGEWTVAATQGAKALAKPYVIKAAEALKMVSMLDVPGVHEAVEEIVSAARAEAEQQAERLRAELAEIEARLAELRDTD